MEGKKKDTSLLHHLVGSRSLVWNLAKNDIKKKFAGSYFGVVWAFVQPVITVLLYWFVFEKGLNSKATDLRTGIEIPFVLWLTAGLVPWFYFQEALNGGTGVLVEYSYLVKNVNDIPRVFREAFYIANTGRKGPVLIDIPIDIQNATIKNFHYPEEVNLRTYKPTVKGHAVQIKKVIRELEKAKRPIICAGGGVLLSEAEEELRAFAEEHRIPVVSTMMGIGVMPTEHPLYYGMVGNNGKAYANRAMNESDLLIMVGASVADIRLTGMTERTGNSKGYPYNPAKMPYYYTGIVQKISDEEFRELLDREIPNGRWSGNLGINDAICQMYYAKSRLARLIYRYLTKMKKKSEAQGKPDLNILFIYNMPFRGIAKMTGGAVSMEMVYGIVDAVNGHFMLGVKKVVGGYFRNRRNNKKYEKLLKGAGGKCR